MPYNLPEILQDPKKWIFLCEGEKDCSTLAKAGLLASTFGGSSDLPEEALRYFKGRRVFICGDYDKAGYERVRATHDALKNIAKDVRHAWLQEPCQTPEINDVTDWFKHGGSVDKLTAQVKKAGEIQPLPRNPSNTILTYNDILQMTPPKWLVFDYILENSTAMLIAPSGSYKSFTALDLALSVASGKDYHGNIVQQADVLYIAGEGSVGYRARCSAWKENYETLRVVLRLQERQRYV